MMLFFDAIWIISLLKVVIGETKEVFAIARKAGLWKCRCLVALYTDYLGVWNFVDWISIVAALQAIVNFMTLQSRQMVLNEEFRHIIEGDTSLTVAEIRVFFSALEQVCSQERLF